MSVIYYPTPERIIEYNLLILKYIKVKKADKPSDAHWEKLVWIITVCKKTKGDIYDKAVVLCKNLIQQHPFASGNRRTAFVVTKEFLRRNKTRFGVIDDPTQSKIMVGIRERYYEDHEIKEWIKNGKIREFKR